MKLIIGISGASGVVIGVELLRRLREFDDIETHLIISDGAALTFQHETNFDLYAVKQLADVVYSINDMDATIASGSFLTDGMVIVPCSMKTVAGITSGYAENLLLRAADVCIKERRKLVIVPREMPFSKIHLRNLKELADNDVVIIPPVLTFYNTASTVQQQIDHIVGKIMLQFGLPSPSPVWKGSSIRPSESQ